MDAIVKAKMSKVKQELKQILNTMRTETTDLQDRAIALEIKNLGILISEQAKLSYKDDSLVF